MFNQEITQHKVKQVPSHRNQVEITTKVTKRPYMKIMEKIRGKIAERLKAYFSPEEWERVVEALSDKHIEQQIIVLMRQDKIQLLNQFNEPVYTKQIKDIISHHASMPRGQAHYVGPEILAPTEITYLDGSDVDTSQNNL